MTNLFLVSRDRQPLWVAAEEPEHASIFTWIPALGRFVYHHPLTVDFYFKYEYEWTPITADQAYTLATAGNVGYFEQNSEMRRRVLAKFTAEEKVRSLAQIFPEQAADQGY